MNKLIFPLFAGIALLASCKENDPPVTLGSSTAAAKDTTYTVSPVPTADLHNVLIEAFSGQSCSNCPAGEELLNGYVNATPGRINLIGYYFYGGPQTIPPTLNPDLRDSAATTIANHYYGGSNGLPSAGIDRVPDPNTGLDQFQNTWGGAINTALNTTDSINLAVSSSYDASTLTATIVTKVTYLQPMTTKQNINVVLVEDSIIGIQEYPAFNATYPSGYDSNYLYMNVCRDVLTQIPQGNAVLDTVSQKTPGLVSQTVFSYHFNAGKGWLPQHCRIIAFVTDHDNEVLQSEQTKLTH